MEREKKIAELEQAIAALEAQRDLLGEDVLQAALAPLRAKLASLAPAASIPGQQLKYVTALFTDIVGSTRMGKDLDPEDILAIMDSALARFKEIIDARGGRVTRFMGDGVKAIFGMPAAHEDDAERAVWAGLDLLEESRRYALQVESHWGLSGFTIRVGINSGYVVLGAGVEAEHTAMGMAINLAARMESAAPPGGLLISHETYRHVRGLFEVDPQPLIAVKGSDEPLQTYLVQEAIPLPFHDARRGVAGVSASMLGREGEMAALVACYERSAAGAGVEWVSLIGDPGVGKSRIMAEFERQLEVDPQAVFVLKCRATEQLSGTPYALLQALFVSHLDLPEARTLGGAREHISEKISPFLGDQAEMKIDFIAALLGMQAGESPHLRGVHEDPLQLRQRALHYLRGYFSALMKERPVVLLLDDIHWADAPSLEAILSIAGSRSAGRMMVLSLARPILLEERPDWVGEVETSRAAHLLIRLGSLSAEHSRALADEILSQVQGPVDRVRELVISKAEGNPFYIEELVKMLVEQGVIDASREGSWQVNPVALGELQVPATLTTVLQARLDRLPPAEKLTLQQASVVGRVFWDAALKALWDQEMPAEDELSGLSRRELVLPGENSPFAGCAEYQFKHDLLRSVVYATVLKADRQRGHARAARWLAETASVNGLAGQYAEAVGRHYEKAGEMDHAAGWYIQAGDSAFARGAPEQAYLHFRYAVSLLPTGNPDLRWRALSGLVLTISRLSAKAQEGLESSRELAALADEMNDPYKRAEALYHQAYFLGLIGQGQVELDALETALQAARASHHQVAASHLLGLRVVSLVKRGELTAAEAAAEEALAYAQEAGDPALLARALVNVSVYYTTAGDLSQAAFLTSRQAEIMRQIGDARGEAYSLENLGYQYIVLGLPERGVEQLLRAQDLAALIGDRRLELYNHLNLAFAYLRGAEHERARSNLDAVIAALNEDDEVFARASSYAYLGMMYEEMDRVAPAVESYHTAEGLFQQAEARGYLCDVWAGLARCLLAAGDGRGAVACAARVWEFLQQNGPSALEFPVRAYLTCHLVFSASGERELAARALLDGCQELERRAGRISDPDWRQSYLQNIPEHRMILERRKR